FLGAFAGGEFSGDCGRENTAGSMSIFGFDTLRPEVRKILPIEQNVRCIGALPMPALNQHKLRSHSMNLKRGFLHVVGASHVLSGQNFSLMPVWRNDQSERE